MDKETAIHEAGQAVGRVITAELRGIRTKWAVDYIDVADPGCIGPPCNRDLFERVHAADIAAGADMRYFWEALPKVADPRETWTLGLCKMLYTVMGTAAVARLNGSGDVGTHFGHPDRAMDRKEFGWVADMLGGDPAFRISLREGIFKHCLTLVETPEIWSAIEKVAAELEGSAHDMWGEEVALITLRSLRDRPDLLRRPLPFSVPYEVGEALAGRDVQDGPAPVH